ncbi:hypothetical protein FGSG_01517 [Fusarium graminearum PH-1]|uniref:Chromosome 1, complete genome n=1 Tax=Gibberella zeae (strain ATCC MYA-4620 / CBS 123657 / FGSC 9075 / NRRL 31084 / PH-1) TaxID=229533 RepID=I1RD30_GIBZE|nr:hypothetical protein FGSG_01517 [Fusarium graminearum PH-1]ESU06841.1 hypothetical protein FGSG_01517 [Fusarium graminearum PH-1]CEF73661.1 unnamed protein product [Fusarium graminearum]|eukprot:XP_011317326.1 hypothetical protein FGSG_01517 [Fusarium graminearum PH-1]
MGDTYNITVTGGSFNQYSGGGGGGGGGRGRGRGRGGFPTSRRQAKKQLRRAEWALRRIESRGGGDTNSGSGGGDDTNSGSGGGDTNSGGGDNDTNSGGGDGDGDTNSGGGGDNSGDGHVANPLGNPWVGDADDTNMELWE